ncbi:glycoside hydrolase family 19 protein [Pseudomonas sp. TNT2022 ID357]|uniref:Glycoside hydrolase family 19 protein n=1 Tax=Pseudomonas idahonensis TaxID=2942628 RepID=A0ABT5Q8A2_9PSED|nr:glycoside hydrolase family 19 protein [Pseudomonas idahonensis]MDD1150417.1 glycoside hydrolase family 19 protein [Pseudomonas idahonensis]
MPITEQQLLQIFPNAGRQAGVFVPALNSAFARFKIDSRIRQAAFLAQVGHESGQLRNLVESLNYRADRIRQIGQASAVGSRWRSLVPRADELGGKPERFGNAVYGGRMGNGPEASGDGFRYRGRGLIQLTGRSNYRAAGEGLGLPLEIQPELLEQPEQAAQSAAWWWARHGLNELADTGRFQDIGSIINTGSPGRIPNGAADRKALYEIALKVLA